MVTSPEPLRSFFHWIQSLTIKTLWTPLTSPRRQATSPPEGQLTPLPFVSANIWSLSSEYQSLSRRAAAPSSFIVSTLIVQILKSRTRFDLATGWPPGIPVASFTPPARATPEDASPVAHLSPPAKGALEGSPLVNPRDGRGGITVLELHIFIFRLLHAQSGRHSDVV